MVKTTAKQTAKNRLFGIKASTRKRKPTHGQISKKAYELFKQRGSSHGYDKNDWYQAEKQLSSV